MVLDIAFKTLQIQQNHLIRLLKNKYQSDL